MTNEKNCTDNETKIYDSWIEKELMDTELTLDMTLEDAYNCIKDSYIHHKSERNAIYLPKAELIALTCIKKVITDNNERCAEWIECEVYYDKENLKHKKFKCSNCNTILHDIIGPGELAVEKYCFNCGYAMFGDYNKKEKE